MDQSSNKQATLSGQQTGQNTEPTVPVVQDDVTKGNASTMDTDVAQFRTEAQQVTAALDSKIPPFLTPSQESGALATVLNRPVLIDEFTWSTGAAVNKAIDPWALFLNDSFVQDRLRNFKYMRGTLELEIQYNGTPFHYGRIIVGYEPINGNRSVNYVSIDTFDNGDYRRISCLPHGYINPTENQVIKFTAPFISPYQWVDLGSATGAQLGRLHYSTISVLRSASASVEPITVTTYAYMKEVEVAFPTRQPIATFTPQSEKVSGGRNFPRKKGARKGTKKVTVSTTTLGEADEYDAQEPNAGMISKPIQAFSNAASALTAVPVIGPYATATATALGKLSKIAAFLGFSKPLDLRADQRYVQNVVGNMVNTDSADSAVSLTVNSKSELTIDPSTLGFDMEEDQMTVSAIAGRWTIAFDNISSWATTDTTGTILAAIPISPFALNDMTANPLLLTSLAYATMPFDLWRGGIQIEVNVVCSRYHRGRLRFEYEPYGLAGNDDAMNTAYSEVVDISQAQRYVLQFDYPLPEPWAQVNDDTARASGLFRIKVQTELTAPDSNSPVEIYYRVRGSDDYMLAKPNGTRLRHLSSYSTQAAATEQGDLTTIESVPIKMFEAPTHDMIDIVTMADPIRSFRQLIKRYEYHTSLGFGGPVTADRSDVYALNYTQFPAVPGTYAVNWGVVDSLAQPTLQSITVANQPLVSYLEQAFLAKKGSFRWIIDSHVASANENVSCRAISVTRTNGRGTNRSAGLLADNLEPMGPRACLKAHNRGGIANNSPSSGVQLFPNDPSGRRIQIELPFYSPFRYITGFSDYATDPNQVAQQEGFQVQYEFVNATTGTQDCRFTADLWCAAGEDFTLDFFLGPPRLWNTTLSFADVGTAYAQSSPTSNGFA